VLGFFRIYSFPWIPERNDEFVELSEKEAKRLTDGRLPSFLPRPDEPKANAEKNRDEGRAILEVIKEVSEKETGPARTESRSANRSHRPRRAVGSHRQRDLRVLGPKFHEYKRTARLLPGDEQRSSP
jgi:hypothetical protein